MSIPRSYQELARAVKRAVSDLNSAINDAHANGLCIEIEQIDTRTISEHYGMPVLNAHVERREEIF